MLVWPSECGESLLEAVADALEAASSCEVCCLRVSTDLEEIWRDCFAAAAAVACMAQPGFIVPEEIECCRQWFVEDAICCTHTVQVVLCVLKG